MEKVLLVYASMSGNTEEVAEIIHKKLNKKGVGVDCFYIGISTKLNYNSLNEKIKDYDAIFIGTYTWDLGYAPDEISDFVESIQMDDAPVYVFGTGETQFGDELFCIASDKIAHYYNSPHKVLKIEQSPRGMQEEKAEKWVVDIINKQQLHY